MPLLQNILEREQRKVAKGNAKATDDDGASDGTGSCVEYTDGASSLDLTKHYRAEKLRMVLQGT